MKPSGVLKLIFYETRSTNQDAGENPDEKYHFIMEKSDFQFFEPPNFPRPEGFTKGKYSNPTPLRPNTKHDFLLKFIGFALFL